MSERFAGVSAVEAQRLVYRVLEAEMGGDIHALSMKTLTPLEWRS